MTEKEVITRIMNILDSEYEIGSQRTGLIIDLYEIVKQLPGKLTEVDFEEEEKTQGHWKEAVKAMSWPKQAEKEEKSWYEQSLEEAKKEQLGKLQKKVSQKNFEGSTSDPDLELEDWEKNYDPTKEEEEEKVEVNPKPHTKKQLPEGLKRVSFKKGPWRGKKKKADTANVALKEGYYIVAINREKGREVMWESVEEAADELSKDLNMKIYPYNIKRVLTGRGTHVHGWVLKMTKDLENL